jgi:signal transduction histidine kinase
MSTYAGVSVVAFAGLLWLLHRLLRWRVSRRFVRALEVRVAERARIARDLHDMLGSFSGLLLHLEAASVLFQTQPDEAKQSLDRTIAQTAQAIFEGWAAVQGLRHSITEPSDLAEAMGRVAEELAPPSVRPEPGAREGPRPMAVRIQTREARRPLHSIVRDEVFRIATEALRNAFQHSHGTQLQVELHYDVRQFVLRIRDDGLGMDSQVIASGGREGHFGLKGMHERAELAGGKLTVRSAPGMGTELELTIPGRYAYSRGLIFQNDAQRPDSLRPVNQHSLDIAGCGGTGMKDGVPGGRECRV